MAKLDIAKLNSLQTILSDSKTALSQKGVTVSILLNEWKEATNWATYADRIISETEANA